jgi:hypothetical protein
MDEAKNRAIGQLPRELMLDVAGTDKQELQLRKLTVERVEKRSQRRRCVGRIDQGQLGTNGRQPIPKTIGGGRDSHGGHVLRRCPDRFQQDLVLRQH